MNNIIETVSMIKDNNLDIRTITMGISLIDCADPDIDRACQKVYDKITTVAKDLVKLVKKLKKNTGYQSLISVLL